MRFQFGTSAILLCTAFVAISLGSGLSVWKSAIGVHPGYAVTDVTKALLLLSPYWLPSVFAAYALGRRELSWRLVILFALAEVAVVAVAIIRNAWLIP